MSNNKTKRSFTDFGKVQNIIGNIKRNRISQISNSLSSKLYLDVGCGLNSHENFVNMDYHWTPNVDVCWDITTKKYPFPNNRFEGIFTEHCLEHISFEDCKKNLFEFFRVLKSGGVLRIVVPDGELYLDIYERRKKGEKVAMPYEDGYISPMHRINGVFRNHGHLFIYDFDTFRILLEEVGFKNIVKQTFQVGKLQALLIDTESRRSESLYVDAEKP